MPNTPKILILSSDTGGGHRSAAQAIAEGAERFWHGQSAAVRIIRGIEESHHITEKCVRLYNWILRNKQGWMKYVFWAVNKFRPETREFFYKRSFGYFNDLFDKWCPHVVVSVHPMTQHFIARLLKDLKLSKQVPLVTVVTDPCYGFWKGWACEDVALYLVANEGARDQLIDYGISPDRIKVSGMPVHPKFHEVTERDAQFARRAYGLDPDKFTIFLNAGWIGGGNIPQIFRELVKGELDIQAIFLAGKNEELRKEAEEIARYAKFPVKVIGYSDEIEKVMQSANVMVSKLGGLTTFEALACRLPIIADGVTPPMPQEAGTLKLIETKGAGISIKHPSEIVATVRALAADRERYSRMRAATIGLAMPNSTEQIIREISAILPSEARAAA